jgi:hypothetical protein
VKSSLRVAEDSRGSQEIHADAEMPPVDREAFPTANCLPG